MTSELQRPMWVQKNEGEKGVGANGWTNLGMKVRQLRLIGLRRSNTGSYNHHHWPKSPSRFKTRATAAHLCHS